MAFRRALFSYLLVSYVLAVTKVSGGPPSDDGNYAWLLPPIRRSFSVKFSRVFAAVIEKMDAGVCDGEMVVDDGYWRRAMANVELKMDFDMILRKREETDARGKK
ncbi:uncharacterized protein G2W53_015956 [Senna tora]|uniref:Uncharacterized protein n=1 Tax=Senna tora TaxID=362788 RepID=A0A834WXA9_9FABA|nr:uncharacterized protein G2W53_015956 [Senna tora]